MYRHSQWDQKASDRKIGNAKVPPLTVRTHPAERKQCIEGLAPTPCIIAANGEVRYCAHIEKNDRGSQISENCDCVPQKRGLEVWPYPAFGRIRKRVVEFPQAPQVDQNEKAGRHQGKSRHRFSEAVDRLSPVGVDDMQDGRKERSGMAHANPENKG